jgi:hypothetical protein
MSCPVTVRLGVYALGAADAAECLLVESHLAHCPGCRAELAQLAPLPALLARVPAELLRGDAADREPGFPAARIIRAAHSRHDRVPGRRRRGVFGMAAAAAVVLGLAGGIWLARPGATQPAGNSARAARTLSGANRVTHVRMTATLTRTSWGTSIRLVAWGLPRDEPCRLIVRSDDGATEVAGGWDAWRAGPVTVPVSVAWRPADIASLQVATASRTLVTVSFNPPR